MARLGIRVWIFAALLGNTAVSASAATDLPAGPGRDIVATVCTSCHELQRIAASGHDRQGWQNVVAMMRNAGAPLPAEKVDSVVAYLATHFPQKAQPAAVLVPGKTIVTFREWQVPTPGSRPHDPLATPDGALWYTGQMANVLGRLDPGTGTFKEFELPPNSGPHGLVADREGNIWYTANFGGYIGRLDPQTGEVKQFKMPDPAARDPHSLVFDSAGLLWFTVQGGNRLGRLDPKTGEVRLVVSPTPASRPYGIALARNGGQDVPFFVEFGSNKIGRIDPATMQIREYVLPHADARPRRLAITDDGIIWYTDYSRGMLGRLDPQTGSVEEFASPGGPRSAPYGIAALDGILWYSESGVEPNTLVRFDPKTHGFQKTDAFQKTHAFQKSHAFQTWAIPSGGGVVRNMMVTPKGGLALACSGVNGVALVDIR